MELFLDAESRGGRREGDAVDLPFGQRHLEQPNVRGVVGLRRATLPLVERLKLPLGRVALPLFIPGDERLLLRRAAAGLQRLATSTPPPAPSVVASGLPLPSVWPSSAPPAAPAVLPMIRVGLTPAQPLSSAPARRDTRKSGRDCMGPFYRALAPALRPRGRNRLVLIAPLVSR